MTDVNIAIHLLKLAIQDRYDTAIIISGDSDLLPALTATRELFPSKNLGIVFPIHRSSFSLKNEADFYAKIKEHHLKSSVFPATVTSSTGDSISCPTDWR